MPRLRLSPVVVTVAAAALLVPFAGPAGAASGTAEAVVFAVNPVQSSGDQDLVDAKDSAGAVPAGEYYDVELTNLDGSGYLRGDWANVRAETGNPARARDGAFVYNRRDDRFEQVMAYYWVTQAQLYLQSLGFGSTLRPVNMESQDVRINQWGLDNSFSWDKHDLIKLGKGGVDDGEDAEVIVHEYGHAVHDAQVAGFGTSLDAGAIGEGFGDYLAVTTGLHVADQNGWPVKATAPCVMDWDATYYTTLSATVTEHCLRRIDRDLKVKDRRNRVHFDGQIWSRALWDIRSALGPTTADRIIINAQFDFEADTSWKDAAQATVATAQAMAGTAAANVVTEAFEDRDIL